MPTATDIAFALAVLAVISTHLPRCGVFLLTLAVVDDLLAIVIIAVFYTSTLHWAPLLPAVMPLALFAVLVERRVRSWWLLLPLAAATWVLMHESGVHATVAGVLLGFAVPVIRRAEGPGPGLAEHFEHRFRPLSAGVAVPVFAFFAAGVSIVDAGGFGAALDDPVTLGGIGFTVSLLIGELAFGAGSATDDHVKIGVLRGSLIAALLASVVLRVRNAHHRRLCARRGTRRRQRRHPGLLPGPVLIIRPTADGRVRGIVRNANGGIYRAACASSPPTVTTARGQTWSTTTRRHSDVLS